MSDDRIERHFKTECTVESYHEGRHNARMSFWQLWLQADIANLLTISPVLHKVA